MATADPPRPGTSLPFAAADAAFRHARSALFPFRFERWLLLGVAAFLDQCGRSSSWGGGGGSSSPPVPPGSWDDVPDWPRLPQELPPELGFAVLIGLVVLVVIAALVALALWIGSRGIFVYLDAVTSGRSEIGRPWREHAPLADSLFVWRFGLVALTFVAVGILAGLGLLVAWLVHRQQLAAGVGLGVGLALLLPVLLVAILIAALAAVALRDFVAPLQLRSRCSAGEAVEQLRPLLKAQPGAFVVYALLKFVFALLAGVLAFVAGCLTCCLGFLPVIGQTLLQPLYYFERSWSLHLLRDLGFDTFAPSAAGGPAAFDRFAPRPELRGGDEGETA